MEKFKAVNGPQPSRIKLFDDICKVREEFKSWHDFHILFQLLVGQGQETNIDARKQQNTFLSKLHCFRKNSKKKLNLDHCRSRWFRMPGHLRLLIFFVTCPRASVAASLNVAILRIVFQYAPFIGPVDSCSLTHGGDSQTGYTIMKKSEKLEAPNWGNVLNGDLEATLNKCE